jgi:signal transduction histidine kinase
MAEIDRHAGMTGPSLMEDLVSLAQRVCDDFADTGHGVSFKGQGRLGYSCQPSALRRALSNLIDNVVKYGEKGRVEIVRAEQHVVIRIDDEGRGIPKDDLEKVFAPFHRVEHSRSRETGGTGLGLNVARTIVRAHGGDITLGNLLRRGLQVEVMLPTS